MRLGDLFQGDNRYKTAMALSGIGSAMRGQNTQGTLQQMLMFDMMRDKKADEERQKREGGELLSNILGGGSYSTLNGAEPVAMGGTPFNPTTRKPSESQGIANDTMRALGKPLDFGQYERQYGLPEGYLAKTAQIESGGNPSAKNPNSSATGLFQFIDSTAQQYGLQDRTNPVASTEAAARLARDNAQILKNTLGREPTAAELYLAHQQGAGGAAKLLANPNARAVDIVGVDAVRLNGGDANMTAGQFAGKWLGKFGGGQPVRTAQSGGMTRDQVLMVMRHPGIDQQTKQFVLGEYRAQQQQGGLTGKERYMNVDGVLYDVSGQQPVAVTQAQPDDSAAMQKISRIKQAYGVDDQTAVGIADGVLRVSRDPYTDQIQITNLATNETWLPATGQGGGQQPAQPAQPAQGQPATTQPQQPQNTGLNFGQPFDDAENAFGLEGMARRGINAATDFVTGKEVFPETAQAQRDFDLLREDITQDLQSAYGQRLPSWALQAVRDLTPAAGGFQGQGAAQGKLKALGRKFQQELQAVEQSLSPANRRGTSPEAWAEMESQRSALQRSLQKINNALAGFDGGGEQNETSSGVKWRVVD